MKTILTALLLAHLWTLLVAIVLALAVPSMCEAADPVRRLFLDDHRDFMPEALPERAELSQPRKKPLSRCDTLSTKPPSQISPTNHLLKTP